MLTWVSIIGIGVPWNNRFETKHIVSKTQVQNFSIENIIENHNWVQIYLAREFCSSLAYCWMELDIVKTSRKIFTVFCNILKRHLVIAKN